MSLPRHLGWRDSGAKNWQSSVGLSAYSQSCGGGSVVLNQHWEEIEIARRESQRPGFQKKVQTMSSKVNKMELRSGIKDKCIRDVLKEYFGLDKLRHLVMF